MYPGYFMTSIPMSIPIASENFHIHIWNLHPILHHLPHRWHKCVMRVPTGPFKGGKDSSIIISVVLMEEAAANARRHNRRCPPNPELLLSAEVGKMKRKCRKFLYPNSFGIVSQESKSWSFYKWYRKKKLTSPENGDRDTDKESKLSAWSEIGITFTC